MTGMFAAVFNIFSLKNYFLLDPFCRVVSGLLAFVYPFTNRGGLISKERWKKFDKSEINLLQKNPKGRLPIGAL